MYSQTCCRLLYLLVSVQVQVFSLQSSIRVECVDIQVQVFCVVVQCRGCSFGPGPGVLTSWTGLSA